MILVKHTSGLHKDVTFDQRTVGHGINGTIPIGSDSRCTVMGEERIESINMGEMAWLIGNTDS